MSGKSPRRRGKDKDKDENNDSDKGAGNVLPSGSGGGGGSRILHVVTIIVAVGLSVGIGQFMQQQMNPESIERQIGQLKTQIANLEKLSKTEQDKKADKAMVQKIREDVSKFESGYATKDEVVKEVDSRTDVRSKKVEERMDSKLELLRRKLKQDSENDLSSRLSELKHEVTEELSRIKKYVDAQFATINMNMAQIVHGPEEAVNVVKKDLKETGMKVDEVVSILAQMENTIDEKIEAGRKKMTERLDRDMNEIRSTVTNWFNELKQKEKTTDKKGKP